MLSDANAFAIPGSSTVEHSAVDCTAEHHKPLFWGRLATKLSPLLVPSCAACFGVMVQIICAHLPFPSTGTTKPGP